MNTVIIAKLIVANLEINSQLFISREGSLPFSQNPATGPYAEPHDLVYITTLCFLKG
jgi:hypothetical protein